jgi:hypothetical protein
MKTIDLAEQSLSVDDLLSIARSESVLIQTKEGTKFVLEEADDFDREIQTLGESERFLKFLEERAVEKGVVSIERFAEGLAE